MSSSFNYSGFQLKSSGSAGGSHNAVPPPPSTGISKQGYSTMNAISQNALSAAWGGSRKRAVTEDEYSLLIYLFATNCVIMCLIKDILKRMMKMLHLHWHIYRHQEVQQNWIWKKRNKRRLKMMVMTMMIMMMMMIL